MTSNWKVNLLNFSPKSFISFCYLLNIKVYISSQLLNWIYKKYKLDFNNYLNLSSFTRKILSSISFFYKLNVIKSFISKDNTIKMVFLLSNNKFIESVLIPNRKNHFTLCLSSQAGCILNCSFCYTGKFLFFGNLKPFEIISQLLNGLYILNSYFSNKFITNIVFMGMGEPLFNLSNLDPVINIITYKDSFGISSNKVTISSSGILDKFFYIKKKKLRLALSLHAPNDNIRTKLMLINKKYNISKLLDACSLFTNKNYFTIEYVMLKGVNDSFDNAYELSSLLKNLNCKVCLIPFNFFESSSYECSSKMHITNFKNILKSNNIFASIRKNMGVDIYGACGQLSGNV